MSGTEAVQPLHSRAPTQLFATVIVVGGGCYGSYYVRQLQRGVGAGALQCDRILVVDRDADCLVSRAQTSAAHEAWPAPVEVVVAEWSAYFTAYLDAASSGQSAATGDAIVPSPLMPHVVADWLVARIAGEHPARRVVVQPLDRAPSVPWSRAAPDGTQYVSFAEWICPINCIEPPLCPELGTPRTWSLTRRIPDYAAAEQERTGRQTLALLVHCRHRTYGVGMFDTAELLNAESMADAAIARGPVDFLIGTVSHCHGALRRVTVD